MNFHTNNGKSHIKENDRQKGYFVYSTRQTGRFSNQIFEYVYWRLKAINDGVQFKNTYDKLPFPFDNIPNEAYDRKKKLEMYDKDAPPYTHSLSCEYFIPHRDLILKLLDIKQFDVDVYDVVVHVRLDDVSNGNNHYSLLPLSYYEFIRGENVLIIGRPIDDEQYKILDKIKDIISKNCKNVTIQSDGDISKDIVSMMSCKELVASISGFWFWPTFLSNNIERVHVPYWGLIKKFKLEKWDKTIIHDINMENKLYKL